MRQGATTRKSTLRPVLSMTVVSVVLATSGACGSESSPSPPQPTAKAPTAKEPATKEQPVPVARQRATALPLVALQWDDTRVAPGVRLRWPGEPGKPGQRPAADEPTTVVAATAPSYASIMAHRRVDDAGIPDEKGQIILECGQGITDPGCGITEGAPGEYLVRAIVPLDARHPFRILYVQWAPTTPGDDERWASWQLPTG